MSWEIFHQNKKNISENTRFQKMQQSFKMSDISKNNISQKQNKILQNTKKNISENNIKIHKVWKQWQEQMLNSEINSILLVSAAEGRQKWHVHKINNNK